MYQAAAGGGDVTFVVTATGSLGASDNSPFTIVTGWSAGTSTYAFAVFAASGFDDITGVTLNGQAMTQLWQTGDTGGGYCGLVVWGIANPQSGDLIVTFGANKARIVGLVGYSGVNTGTPIGSVATDGTVVSDTDTTPSITGVDSGGKFLNVACGAGDSSAISFGGGETERASFDYDAAALQLGVAEKNGSASTTVTATFTGTTRVNVAGFYINKA